MPHDERACPACATANPPAAQFCMACGAALGRTCGECGAEAPPQARFCMSCGAPLAGGRPPSPTGPLPGAAAPPPRAPVIPDAIEQRRRVTVLFADLSGYTAISERLDPEAVRDLADRSLRRLSEEVERYGGTIDKYIGDNVMAIFGAPVAHEDDPERAVLAAFGMQAAMSEINAELAARHGARFALRVGINTGEVLAGSVAGAYTVMGDAVNVASRLQGAGAPGTVTVGELTYRATAHRISYRELEPLALKGKAQLVSAWEALEPAREPAGSRASSAPLVGRADELAQLESHYRRVVHERRPRLVTVMGEAGVGKSRLLAELAARLQDGDDPPLVREGRCLAYGSGTVFWAFGEIVREECGIDDADGADAAWAKLEARVRAAAAGADDEAVTRTAALVGRILGMEPPAGVPDPAEGLDPQRLREELSAGVRTLVEGIAAERPVVLAFEDIHWADHGLLDLVEHVAQWARGPLLVLAMARDELLERRPGWGAGRRASTVFLEPLSMEQSRELVAALLPEGGGTATAVAERSGGNPFFAEEMARRLSDDDVASVAELPDTVQALLAARLDALAPAEHRLVQRAAVIGRTFWPQALADLAAAEHVDLRATLDGLAEKELIVPGEGRRLAGEPELAFKHVLIRDVAYEMLPRAARARAHVAVAQWVQQRAGDRTDEVAGLLAEHYGRAASLAVEAHFDESELAPVRAAALRFLEAAGDTAGGLFANEEAIGHYAAALELVTGAEEPALRARIADKLGDVALRVGRITVALEAWRACLDYHRSQEDLAAIGGTLRKIGAALAQQGERRAAIEHYQQGMNLLKDGPPTRELVRLYEDAAWLYVQSGDNMLAIYAAEKALRLAQQLGEATAVSRAHGIFGRVFSRIGDAGRARENLERAVELARDDGAHDELEVILALLALANHLEAAEADYGAAEAAYREALEVAERIGDVPSQVELHSSLAQLAVYHADWEAVGRLSDASARLAEGAGLVLKLCLPHALRGLMRWREGDWQGSEQRFRRAAELAEEVGWSEIAFAALYGLSVTLRDREDYDGALAALDRALEVSERAGLTVQSVQAVAHQAVVLTMAGHRDEARAAAEEAGRINEALHSPVSIIAALEADGATAPPELAPVLLRSARDAWRDLGRPLDAARCQLLEAGALRAQGADASEASAAAVEAFEQLGVAHLAGRARALATPV